ncbi:MAG: hypothetical protein ABI559_08435, partial [Chloroflexota bacterium]
YRAAYDILLSQPETPERDRDLLELLNEWSLLHYYTAEINVMDRLMTQHSGLLDSVLDPELCGMWLTWHCFVAYSTNKFEESFAAADRAIALGEECGSMRVLAYAYTQKAWAFNGLSRGRDFTAFAEKALSLVDGLKDERDARYIRLKAACGASLGRLFIGDLIKSRALAHELLDFAIESGSARALSFAHLALSQISALTGDAPRALVEVRQARAAALDPFYKSIAEAWLGSALVNGGELEEARAVILPAMRFGQEHGTTALVRFQQLNEAMLNIAEGELTRGMDQLAAIKRSGTENATGVAFVAGVNEAVIYARIATGEGAGKPSVGTLVKNAGFVIGRARKASQIAHEALTELSENLPADREGIRFVVELELAKLLIKRKERDEARKHIEEAINYLQPLGDGPGIRNARALLATLDVK